MARLLRAIVLAGALSGCGLLGGAEDEALEERHVVFLTEPGCAWVVVKTTEERFSVLASASDFAPRRGDVFLGNLRLETQPLRIVPFPSSQIGGVALFEVAGARLALAEAQGMWRGLCPAPPGPVVETGGA